MGLDHHSPGPRQVRIQLQMILFQLLLARVLLLFGQGQQPPPVFNPLGESEGASSDRTEFDQSEWYIEEVELRGWVGVEGFTMRSWIGVKFVSGLCACVRAF